MTLIEAMQTSDPIKCIYEGSCASLSKRSTLTYEIGKHGLKGVLYLRIIGNTGRGNWSKGWICGMRIDDAVANQIMLTGERLHDLQHGRSRNTGGFVLAVLIDLGLVRKGNARFYEHVPKANFKNVVAKRLKDRQN